MRSLRSTLLPALLAVLLIGAGALAKDKDKDKGKGHDPGKGQGHASAAPGHSGTKALGIPPGHLPRPGLCRIWRPGVPPGHQPAAGPCRRLERRLRPGEWLLYRSKREPDLVYVDVVEIARPRDLVEVRVFHAGDGMFVRLEAPGAHYWRRIR